MPLHLQEDFCGTAILRYIIIFIFVDTRCYSSRYTLWVVLFVSSPLLFPLSFFFGWDYKVASRLRASCLIKCR